MRFPSTTKPRIAGLLSLARSDLLLKVSFFVPFEIKKGNSVWLLRKFCVRLQDGNFDLLFCPFGFFS
jgi:hypothetical protein